MTASGNPMGAGRKPSPPNLKKIPLGLKLPRWLIEWLRAHPRSNAILIEDALKSQYGLKSPEAE